MHVSIITVCLNSKDTIVGALDSVRSQSYPNIEHVVIDGKSQDGTLEELNSYRANHRLEIVSESDSGLYDALNKGVRKCQGDVIGILHADDRFTTQDEIAKVVELFELNPDMDIVFGDIDFVDNHTDQNIVRKYRCNSFQCWKLRFGIMPAHTATFVRKEVYDKHGLYDISFKISADFERFVRWFYVEKISFKYLDRIVTKMKHGGVSTAGLKSSYVLNKEIIKACRLNGLKTNFLLLALKIPYKLLSLRPLKK